MGRRYQNEHWDGIGKSEDLIKFVNTNFEFEFPTAIPYLCAAMDKNKPNTKIKVVQKTVDCVKVHERGLLKVQEFPGENFAS